VLAMKTTQPGKNCQASAHLITRPVRAVQQRCLVVADQETHQVEPTNNAPTGRKQTQSAHLISRPDRVVQQRSFVVVNLKRHANTRQRREDVTEKDHTIRLEAAPGLRARSRGGGGGGGAREQTQAFARVTMMVLSSRP
jgi:hypothetical protein